MKHNRRILHYSILTALFGAVIMPSFAAVKVNNTSRPNRASMYQQINAASINATAPQSAHVDSVAEILAGPVVTGSTDAELPIRVANEKLAAKIAQGDPNVASIDRLRACSEIYPNGEFEWATPTVGLGAGGAATCVSVVELRGYQMGENGADLVVARGKLAAGDSFKCNISEFSEFDVLPAAGEITFPADSEPTTDDVIKVLNQEQKQNAGIKIAASVLVGGVGGNIAGKNEVGKDGLMGTGKGKMKGTVIGALGAGALTTAATYSGKVAGDTIMSAGVNAAAGGVVGNIMASGDSVLRIEDCKLPNGTKGTCLWGMLIKETPLDMTKQTAYVSITDDANTTYVCDAASKNCRPQELIKIYLDVIEADGTVKESKMLSDFDANELLAYQSGTCPHCHMLNDKNEVVQERTGDGSGILVKIKSAGIPGTQMPAMIAGVDDKAFGLKNSEWKNIKNDPKYKNSLYGRATDGSAFVIPKEKDSVTGEMVDVYDITDFNPMMVDATDGGIIDLGNKARLKTTLVGAGVGGALGAFSGYQGAQDEVSARWVSAVREYKDSLQKVVCMTGNRFLGFYNDTIIIPNVNE